MIYTVHRMYDVTENTQCNTKSCAMNHSLKSIPFPTLHQARAAAKEWCAVGSEQKNYYFQNRSAVIDIHIPEKHKRILLETYVEDAGGSGRAIQTRKYNSKTKRSILI